MSLDHLFLDQEGIPTLVEVKRSSDTRIRREVVGQMLDYAANAVTYWPIEKIRARFEARCEKANRDPSQELADFLGNFEDGELDEELFWQKANTNLKAGRIRMIFVADEIPFQLRRIVEFLNEQMSTAEVLAIEVKQYVGQGLQTLVPRIIGVTDPPPPPPEGKQWNAELFFEGLDRNQGQAAVELAKHILQWASKHMPDIWWGKGKQNGSFVPVVAHGGIRHQLIGVWTSGYVELQFAYIKSRGSLDDAQRLALLNRFNQTLGTNLADEQIHRRPSITIATLSKPEVLDGFLKDLEWALDEIRNGGK
jgi:hypothetical protein